MKIPTRTLILSTLLVATTPILAGCSLLPFGHNPPPSPRSARETAHPQTQKQDVFSLKVGDCLNDQSGSTVSDVPAVDCAAAHDLEVFYDFTIADANFDATSIGKQADDRCQAQFAAFVGIAYDDSTLEVQNLTPTAGSWAAGDRVVSCLIDDPAGKTLGTLRGAAR